MSVLSLQPVWLAQRVTHNVWSYCHFVCPLSCPVPSPPLLRWVTFLSKYVQKWGYAWVMSTKKGKRRPLRLEPCSPHSVLHSPSSLLTYTRNLSLSRVKPPSMPVVVSFIPPLNVSIYWCIKVAVVHWQSEHLLCSGSISRLTIPFVKIKFEQCHLW